MSINLGFVPLALTVTLAADADFAATLVAQDGWPVDTQIELRFPLPGSTVVWPATVVGTDAAWNVDIPDVAALLVGQPRRVRLYYSDGAGADLLWASGSVVIIG